MNRSASLPESDYVLLAAFRCHLREFLHFSEEAAHRAGLHPQQHQALLVIRGVLPGHRVTVGELAGKLKIRHHTAVELVRRMEGDRLLVKERDPEDGRRVLLRLTARSARVLGRLSVAHKAELARIGPALRDTLSHLRVLS